MISSTVDDFSAGLKAMSSGAKLAPQAYDLVGFTGVSIEQMLENRICWRVVSALQEWPCIHIAWAWWAASGLLRNGLLRNVLL